MKVDVLAHTVLDGCADSLLEDAYEYDVYADRNPYSVADADVLAEAAGRICYKSFNRPNPKTAKNADYLANILSQQHYSVLEHASVSFLVRHVSRALLAELTRHRHLSFSVVSQRYCDYANTEPVIPPAVRGTDIENAMRAEYRNSLDAYEEYVEVLMEDGVPRKKAREAARGVLPNSAPVDLVFTGNIRALRDMLGKRHSVHADAELQELASLVLGHLREIAPASVQDIPDEPYGSDK